MWKVIKIQLVVFIGILLSIELGLRAIYYNMMQSTSTFAIMSVIHHVSLKPPGLRLNYASTRYEPDQTLGYRQMPGQHPVLMHFIHPWGKKVSLNHTETVGQDGYRITAPDNRYDGQPEIWLFGCSYTYGSYIKDEDTAAWMIQEKMPEYKVKNYGVGSYGQIQGLLQFKQQLAAGHRPKLAVFHYGDFHQIRNVQSDEWLKNVKTKWATYSVKAPSGGLDPAGNLVVDYRPIGQADDRDTRLNRDPEAVTIAIFKAITQLAKDNQIPIVVGVYYGSQDNVVKSLEEAGVPVVYFDINTLANPAYNQEPLDAHPNRAANAYFTQRLYPEIHKRL